MIRSVSTLLPERCIRHIRPRLSLSIGSPVASASSSASTSIRITGVACFSSFATAQSYKS